MARVRRLPRWSLIALLVITVAGGLLRFDAASRPDPYQSRDETAYAMIARNLVANHTYGALRPDGQADAVHWPPGAPVLFAIAHKLSPQFRGDGRWDVPAAYNWQAGIGTATILAAFVLALLLAGPAAGVLAAAAVAFYPPLITASGDLLSEPLGALLLTSAIAAAVLTIQTDRRRWAVLAGLLLAATILTRADLLAVPFIAVAAVAIVGWRRAGGDRRWAGMLRTALPMFAALIVAVTPWTIFASDATGHFVPLSSGGASNLWVGTYLPGNGSIFGAKKAMEAETKRHYPQLAQRRYFQITQVQVIDALVARHPGLTREEALRKESLQNVRDYALGRPIDFAGMMLSKVWRLWGNYTRGTHGEPHAWIRALHLLIVFTGLAGLVAGLLYTRRPELWLLAAIFLYLSLLNAVLVSESRHNLTAMPLVAVAGIAGAAMALTARRSGALLPRPALPRRRARTASTS